MDEYTFENLITNPETPGLENLIGKEVYFDDVPIYCIKWANEDYEVGVLKGVRKGNPAPFFVKTSSGCVLNYPCIIPKKEEPYEERSKRWIEENDLKAGDYVKVLRKTKPFEKRWGGFWVDQMNDYIGKTLKVLAINSLNGLISLECDYIGYNFPYFVLEKAEPPKPKYVPFESKEEFIEAFRYHDNANYSETDDILLNYGMWLKSIEYDYGLVTRITDNVIKVGNSSLNWTYLLDHYTFLDGTPCGKLKESK